MTIVETTAPAGKPSDNGEVGRQRVGREQHDRVADQDRREEAVLIVDEELEVARAAHARRSAIVRARSREIETSAASEAAKNAARTHEHDERDDLERQACGGTSSLGRCSNRRHYSTTWGRTST